MTTNFQKSDILHVSVTESQNSLDEKRERENNKQFGETNKNAIMGMIGVYDTIYGETLAFLQTRSQVHRVDRRQNHYPHYKLVGLLAAFFSELLLECCLDSRPQQFQILLIG